MGDAVAKMRDFDFGIGHQFFNTLDRAFHGGRIVTGLTDLDFIEAETESLGPQDFF